MVSSSDPFSQERGLPIGSALIVAIVAVLGAFVVGGLLFFSAYYTYLIIGSVVIAALLVGLLVMLAVRMTRLRNLRIVIFLAMLSGLLMYGTYRYLEYGDFIRYEQEWLYSNDARMDEARANKVISTYLIEETGYDGPVGFWLWQAQQGLEITSTRSSSASSAPTVLGKELTIGYWVVEILIVLAIPVAMALERAKQPFCEETGSWLKFNPMKGRIAYNSISAFDEAVSRRDFAAIAKLLETSTMWRANLKIDLGRCTDQSPDGIIRVTRLEGRATRVVYEDIVTRDEYNTLLMNSPQ